MDITVVRGVRLVGLLDPECDWLGDQRFEFDVVIRGNGIQRELVITAQARLAHQSLWQKNISAQWRVQFKQAVALQQAAFYCRDNVLRAHTASYLCNLRPRAIAR